MENKKNQNKKLFGKAKGLFSKIKINKKQLRYLLPVGALLFLLFVFLGSRIIPAMLANNVYNMGDLEENLKNVKEGDIINYNINGYNNWRVLSVDKENGTVEVTSNSNVYNLTLEPNQTAEEYNAIFQAEADRFNDGRYVTNARTIAKSDSLMFDTKGEYWLANVNENSLMTNKTGSYDSARIPFKDDLDTDRIYVLPFFEIVIPDGNSIPSKGYVLNFQFNGVNSWVYTDSTRRQLQSNNNSGDAYGLTFEAQNPVPLYVTGYKDVNNAVNTYLKQFENLHTEEVAADLKRNFDYSPYGDIVTSKYGLSNNKNTILNHSEIFGDSDYVYYYFQNSVGHGCIEKKYYYECTGWSAPLMKVYRDGRTEELKEKYYPKKLTFGYRPVLTLKVGDGVTGKDTNEKLHIGDNVRYEANGYRNWKVLSVDKYAGTVDVISGGVVKNLSLYGIDDYNNYEDILQNEVNAYISGDNAISARAVEESDVDLLTDMNDTVSAMYWYNKKFEVRSKNTSINLQTSSNQAESELSYGVGILWTNHGDYYVNNNINSVSSSNITKYWVKFYSKNNDNFQYYLGNGDANYIAGLRPIITLKYDAVEKVSSVQARKLDKSSKDYDKYYTSEQLNNNFHGERAGLLFIGDGEGGDNIVTNNGGKNSSDINYNKVNVSLGETTGVLNLAVTLAIIYGLIIITLVTTVSIYRFNLINRSNNKE